MTAGFVLLITAQIAVRGTVLAAETHEPLGFSIVTLQPDIGRQFTDPRGAFAFGNAKPGTYVLSVRQIGYTPFDTQLVIRGDSAIVIEVLLRHLAIELPPITIAGRQCVRPGRPDSSDAALLAVFNQLQENARRFALFADSYPFRPLIERTIRDISIRGDTVTSVESANDPDRPYEVGHVVFAKSPLWPDQFLVHTAVLQDFGNTSFVENHCFDRAGVDTIAGRRLIRIDFEPPTRLRTTDIAGSAFLDSTTYELRFTESRLTHPEWSVLSDIDSSTARTRFKSLAPGIPVQDSLIAITTYRGRHFTKRVETQRLLDVHFRRRPPS
jgi:hypothetical protein